MDCGLLDVASDASHERIPVFKVGVKISLWKRETKESEGHAGKVWPAGGWGWGVIMVDGSASACERVPGT